MKNILKLYNTFTRSLDNVQIKGQFLTVSSRNNDGLFPSRTGSLYICGPTVYSDCHIGHALTYVRADLFRKFMKSLFNTKLITVMNITDIDDKILAKTRHELGDTGNYSSEPEKHSFNHISDKYFKSFTEDLEKVRVDPPDLFVRVSRNINLIMDFIRTLERNGFAYVSSNKDVLFRVEKSKNYIGRVDKRKNEDLTRKIKDLTEKNDLRDFVLWKLSKPDEPIWTYDSTLSNISIPGRPGWHVQCSAIASAIFGKSLDFHYGGKDLIFPHHYNEQACCSAFHNLDTWANNWLHSGHLIFKNDKMSKSLGNVIPIKDFSDRVSVNSLRILCIKNHYRTDLVFDQDMLDIAKAIDHRLNAFNSYLDENIKLQCDDLQNCVAQNDSDMDHVIERLEQEIIEGVCDDLDLGRGLSAIVEASKFAYTRGAINISPLSMLSLSFILKDWFNTCGLVYASKFEASSEGLLYELVRDFRNDVRSWTISEIKKSNRHESNLNELLRQCDDVRIKLENLGYVQRDNKI